MYGADRAAPRPSHGKMNDPGRKVNIQPAENEFSELMRSLRARTDNEGNHVGRDFVGCEGIDRKIILPKRADQLSPANVHAVMDVLSKSRVKKTPYLCYSLVLRLSTASVTIRRALRALQDHCTGLLIGSWTAERLWRFVDSCIGSRFSQALRSGTVKAHL